MLNRGKIIAPDAALARQARFAREAGRACRGLTARRAACLAARPAQKGLTLVEVMLAVSVVVIAALGTLCFEYLTVDHIRIARAQLAATRVGQLLIEDWKSTGGSTSYSPEALDMGFVLPPDVESGDFMTVLDGLPLFIDMNQREVDRDDAVGAKLYELDVTVRWNKDFGDGPIESKDPGVVLNTYVRRDQ